jgi:spoIIIJ-associated protein
MITLPEFLNLFIRSARLKLSFEVSRKEAQLAVNFTGEDRPILLARSAAVLQALESLCNRMFERKGVRIILDSDGYRSVRAEELQLMAVTAAENVKRLGRPFSLNPMSPEERRIVHLAVADDKAVRTESEGHGENRMVVIHPQ